MLLSSQPIIFLVTSGSVTIKDGGVSNDELANPSITVSDGINFFVCKREGITYSAGEGIVVGESNKNITLTSAEDATDTNKGIASLYR